MARIFEDAGELILGTRLKRLGDRFLDEVSAIYKNSGIGFEPSWFAVFFTLNRYGSLTMSEIADSLGVTQSAISQIVSSVEKNGFVKIEQSNGDKRIRVVSLTDNALKLLLTVKPIWRLIKIKMEEMLKEGRNSKYMLEALGELERSFAKRPLSERVAESMEKKNFKIEPYSDSHFLEFKRLLFSWMFSYGAPDIKLINNLQAIIKNSRITVAFRDKNAIAAVMILKSPADKDVFLINKNDFSDEADFILVEEALNSQDEGQTAARIYLDSDNSSVENFLKEKGFNYKNVVKFSDAAKKLSVFEGIL